MEARKLDNELVIYTTQEVAAMLKVHKNTVKRYLSEGKIKGFKLGTDWRVKQEDLMNFIDKLYQ